MEEERPSTIMMTTSNIFRSDKSEKMATASTYGDTVRQEDMVWFFIFTGVIKLSDSGIVFTNAGQLYAFIGDVWYWWIRVACLGTLVWGIVRFSYYFVHEDGYPLFASVITASCLMAQSLTIFPMISVMQRKLNDNLMFAEEAQFLRLNFKISLAYLVFSILSSIAYAGYRLLDGRYYYFFLLWGQFGTAVLIAPVLLLQRVNIGASELLVSNIYKSAVQSKLSSSFYLKLQRDNRNRLHNDFWPEFAFFFVNLLNICSILVSLIESSQFTVIDNLFYILMFFKELIITTIVLYGAAKVNDLYDKNMADLTEILLQSSGGNVDLNDDVEEAHNPLLDTTHTSQVLDNNTRGDFRGMYDFEVFNKKSVEAVEASCASVSLLLAMSNMPISYKVLGIRFKVNGILAGIVSFVVSFLLIVIKYFLV